MMRYSLCVAMLTVCLIALQCTATSDGESGQLSPLLSAAPVNPSPGGLDSDGSGPASGSVSGDGGTGSGLSGTGVGAELDGVSSSKSIATTTTTTAPDAVSAEVLTVVKPGASVPAGPQLPVSSVSTTVTHTAATGGQDRQLQASLTKTVSDKTANEDANPAPHTDHVPNALIQSLLTLKTTTTTVSPALPSISTVVLPGNTQGLTSTEIDATGGGEIQGQAKVIVQPQDDAATTTMTEVLNTREEHTQMQVPATTINTGQLDGKGTSSSSTKPSGAGKGGGNTPPSTHTSTPIATVRQAQTNPVRPEEGDGPTIVTTKAATKPARQTAGQDHQPHLVGPATVPAPPPNLTPTTGHTAPAKSTKPQTLLPATSPQLQTPATGQTPSTTTAAAVPVKDKTTTSRKTPAGPAQNLATTDLGVKDNIQAQTLKFTTSTAAPTSSTQTSETSTTESAKTESTAPVTFLTKFSNKLQQVDLKDGSTGSSSLSVFTAFVTLVVMAIGLAP